MSPRWTLLAALLATPPAILAAGEPPPRTVDSLRGADVQVDVARPVSADPQQVRAAYRRFLQTGGGDARMRAEALRRLADLELEAADTARGDGSAPGAGSVETRAAIRLYEELLSLQPDHPRIDSVLYQLGRACEAEAEMDRALGYLDRLIRDFPGSRHIIEAQFRRGEILFSARQWASAEAAYAAALASGTSTPFYEQALYKHGWALFKQSRTEDSARSLLKLLDRKLLTASGADLPDLSLLSRADRELVEDTTRALGIQFSADDPAATLSAALARHGQPAYGWRLHASLGDLLVGKERYTDAADTYRAFAAREPADVRSPELQARAIEAYLKGGFAELALDGKREFVERYGFGQPYWAGRDHAQLPQVVQQLRTNVLDLAKYHHARAQAEKRTDDYREAARWYRDYLQWFPDEPDAATTSYLLADVLYESRQYGAAAEQYRRSAYEYPRNERSAAAGYAQLVARDLHEEQLAGAARTAWRRDGIDSAERFATTFAEHPEAGRIWLRAATRWMELTDYARAADAARRAVAHAPPLSAAELQAAWSVTADSSFERGLHGEAEAGYREVLARLPADSPQRSAVAERLAASVYRQGEARQQAGDIDGAVQDFLRIEQVVPGAGVVVNARHDAATLLLREQRWQDAIPVLESLRRDFPASPLAAGIARNLAAAYVETGKPAQAALEFSRVADDAGESDEVRRAALLRAAELHEQSGDVAATMGALALFVERYPTPLDDAIATRQKLADLAGVAGNARQRAEWLSGIIAADRAAGAARTPRSRTLAARASLELAAPLRAAFEALTLRNPLPRSLKDKRDALETALKAYQAAADYDVAEVTTAATYATAELYRRLASDLMASERPRGLDADALEQYALLLEEQAYPFEERAIELHEANAARAEKGLYDDSVRASYLALSELKPGRYRRQPRLPEAAGDETLAIALAAIGQGSWAEAELLLGATLPTAATLTALGVARQRAGRFEAADEAYQAASAADALDPLPAINRGLLLDLYLARPAAALAEYQRGQALLPAPDAELDGWIAELALRAGPAAPPEEVQP